MNELSYKPKGSRAESTLFYLPWLNHNFNAAFNLQDAGGPLLRSLALISCTGSALGYPYASEQTLKGNPYLQTLIEAIGLPYKTEIPVSFKVDNENGTCESK